MPDETLNTTAEIDFTQLGFQSASKAQAEPASITDYLNYAYKSFLDGQGKGKTKKIEQLQQEIDSESKRKNESEAKNEISKQQKELKNKELRELTLAKAKIREADAEVGDISTFIIGAFITLMLTMYLFVFYSSSGYSAFYGIKPGSLGFISPTVFADAANKGGGVIALIVLFPVIFLGLGFLIHDSLETNKKLKKAGNKESYALITMLLFITLIADMFIGYKISQGVHINEFNAGLTTETWEFNMILSDINFYLVLVLGFVVYVVWGFLLNRVLSHPYLKTEDEITRISQQNKEEEIASKREEVNKIEAEIAEYLSSIKNNDLTITTKQDSLLKYKTSTSRVIFDMVDLRSIIGNFMSGWESFTIGYWGSKALEYNALARKIKEEWLQTKNNLQSDN